MSRAPLLPSKPDVLTDRLRDPVYMAAQGVAAQGEGWVQVEAPPKGEVIWSEAGDTVRLTPDGWLVYVNGCKVGIYTSRLRATPDHIAVLREQGASSSVIQPHKPVLRKR